MSPPLVSVVIASWNTRHYLPETLASALEQSWPDLEVIVVDDGSTDGTREAIAEFLPRIRYEARPHRGLAAARNEGIRLARGEYIALLDADDLWHPEKIATQVEIAGRYPEAGMIVCNGVEFSEHQALSECGDLSETLLAERFLRALQASPSGEVAGDFQRDLIPNTGISCPAQVLLPRRVVEEVGPFVGSGAQDHDYYLRVSLKYPIVFHAHSHVRWRFRPDSMSGDRRHRMSAWTLFALPVLKAHRRRCRPADLPLLDDTLRKRAGYLSYDLMAWGREGKRLAATARLLRVFRLHPWPPTALMYLAGLWSPRVVYQVGARATRPFRGGE